MSRKEPEIGDKIVILDNHDDIKKLYPECHYPDVGQVLTIKEIITCNEGSGGLVATFVEDEFPSPGNTIALFPDEWKYHNENVILQCYSLIRKLEVLYGSKKG